MGILKAIIYTANDVRFTFNEGVADDRATRNYVAAIVNSARHTLIPNSVIDTFKYARTL
jgi:hypothetical protein